MDILTVRMHGDADNSPLEMISAKRLAHLKRVEAAARDLLLALASSDEGRTVDGRHSVPPVSAVEAASLPRS